MRRSLSVATVAALASLALAGCSLPPGVDGDLTDSWSAMPEAKIPTPPANACYAAEFRNQPSEVTKLPDPVDCTTTHTMETIHVGGFTGVDASSAAPPAIGGPGRRRAYEECATHARTFLGDDWRTGRLELSVATPIPLHWDAGARWFRCDLVEYADVNDFRQVSRTSSLKGALSGSRPVGLTCFTVTVADDAIEEMPPVDCTSGHHAEFAGVYDMPDTPFVTDDTQRRNMQTTGCHAIMAAYANIPDDGSLSQRTGLIRGQFGKEYWDLGNRGVRCYFWDDRGRTGSLKGAGPTALPVGG